MISKKPLTVTMGTPTVTMAALGDVMTKVAKSIEGLSKVMQEMQEGNVRKQLADKWTLEGKPEDM